MLFARVTRWACCSNFLVKEAEPMAIIIIVDIHVIVIFAVVVYLLLKNRK
jgi:hypothetical protein